MAQAEHHYHEALALATHLGMRPLVAHCRLEPDKLYQRMGRREETREHLATATTMYREMTSGSGWTRPRWRPGHL